MADAPIVVKNRVIGPIKMPCTRMIITPTHVKTYPVWRLEYSITSFSTSVNDASIWAKARLSRNTASPNIASPLIRIRTIRRISDNCLGLVLPLLSGTKKMAIMKPSKASPDANINGAVCTAPPYPDNKPPMAGPDTNPKPTNAPSNPMAFALSSASVVSVIIA